MFHLKAGVHFDKEKLALLVEKLDCAGANIIDLCHSFCAGRANAGALFGRDCGSGGLFKHLLMAALQRTVTFGQMHGLAFAITKHLDFYMARRGQVFLDIDFVIAESGFALGARGEKGAFHISGTLCNLHAPTAAACSGFDDHRIAHFSTNPLGLIDVCNSALRAGHAGHSKIFHRVLGGYFIPHDPNVLRCWSNKYQAVVFDDLNKAGVFGQKAIAGVNRLCASDFAGGNDRWNGQVAVCGIWWADTDRLVCHADMHCVAVGG